MSEPQAAKYAHQIVSAMRYCHSQNVVHRDLKPENILFQTKDPDSQVVIIDFGTSRIVKETEKMNKTFGTVYYIAPEVLEGQYTAKCDVWSVGIIIYILLSGMVPFGGRSDTEIFENVRNAELQISGPFWDWISDSAKDLLRNMINRDVQQRFTMD
jgi:calcium-dependent protein kinase